MKFPFSLLTGKLGLAETSSLVTAPSSAESAANFFFGREASTGPRRRQGRIPTVSISSGTDGSNPAPSTAESAAMKGSRRDPVAHQCPLVMTRQFVNHDERQAYANRSKISGE